eukprot:CAMPEP_0184490960 /NCGR_PEP_ID=MMETSP0113_2-20130426/19280_1 /TAXON_ID=91329 /ORGANISM="Norrisiella sphaerica, Strain BC52" /LENGTH=834 /DNA_ID=CAMNT_0026875105 /DNA_START=98 /DNA_END=2602 /DNA_ORIENTATION=+
MREMGNNNRAESASQNGNDRKHTNKRDGPMAGQPLMRSQEAEENAAKKIHSEGDRGPQKRASANTFKGTDAASSISNLLEEYNIPVLDESSIESSLSTLSNLTKVASDEKITQEDVAKHVENIKQLVSNIRCSYEVLTHQEAKLKRARQLLHKAQREQASTQGHDKSDLQDRAQTGTFIGSDEAGDMVKNGSRGARKEREQHTKEELEKKKEQVEQYKRLVEEVENQIGEGRLDPNNASMSLPQPLPSATLSNAPTPDKKQAEIERLTAEVEKCQEELGQYIERISGEQQEMQQVYELQQKLRKEKANLQNMQQQLTKEQAKVREAEKKNKKLRAQIDRDKSNLDRDRQNHKKKEEDLKAERSKAKKLVEDAQSEKKSVDQERSQLKKDLKKLEKEKDRIAEEQKRLETERKKVQKDKDRLKKDVQKAQNAKEKMEKERQKADQEACNAQRRKDKILADIQKALAEEKEKRQELKEIEKTKAQLKLELEQMRKEQRKMEKRRSKSPIIKQQAQKQSSSDESSEASGLRKKLLQLENENKLLKKKLESNPGFPMKSPPQERGVFGGKPQQDPADAWAKTSAAPQHLQDNKQGTINTFSFSQNTWLRSINSSMNVKDTRNIPRFAWRAGIKDQAQPLGLSTNFGGPPGFSGATTSQPMGGLMFAQRGKKVMARYRGDDQWYDAEIKEVILNGAKGPKYIVKFQGYPGKETVYASDIRPKDGGMVGNDPPVQSNGHNPGIHPSGIAHGPPIRSQWGAPLTKNDRPGVWGMGDMKPTMGGVLNGLNTPPLMTKSGKMGRGQFRDTGGFYGQHLENGGKQEQNPKASNVLKAMLTHDRS